MIVSWNWLSQYVTLDMPVDELTHRLMMAGFNHEGTEDVEGDLAIDLEVTSNRADCLCHLGVAREVGTLFQRVFSEPDARPKESGAPVETLTSVQVDKPELCPFFTARVVSGVSPGESPWWMRRRLKTLGVRPVSNIVDITNYVMFECGQPLHTYDLDTLAERRLWVREAKPGETLKAINGRTYELSTGMLTIADAQRPVGLAGVMGGLETEIGSSTRNVLIEAAVFDPVSVRGTARALGLHSPSSFRFERGVDAQRTEWASRRCAGLILELAGGALHPGVVCVGSPDRERKPITLRTGQFERVLGISIDRDRAHAILCALGLEARAASEGSATFLAPAWRPDLEREIDLVEEVARIHGYEHIPEDRDVPLISSARGPRDRVESEARAALAGMGFHEACTPSLVAEVLDVPLTVIEPPRALRVDHSTRKRENVLRRGLVPSLLAVRSLNEKRGVPDASLYEIACVYWPHITSPLPEEPVRLAIVGSFDYLGIKGTVETLLDRLHVAGHLSAHPVESTILTRGRAAELRLDGLTFGLMGELEAGAVERFELRSGCGVAELDFGRLIASAELTPQYRKLPEYPAVERDLSLLVEEGVTWEELSEAVRSSAGLWLESVSFLDVYRGKGVPDGSKSVHFGLRFRHEQKTLSGDEVERSIEAIVQACRSRLGAMLRA
jgi:phenylalanyl-tRNA synthetase beta chain